MEFRAEGVRVFASRALYDSGLLGFRLRVFRSIHCNLKVPSALGKSCFRLGLAP